jgi:hypothetical protein
VSLHVASPSAKIDHQSAGSIVLFYGYKVAADDERPNGRLWVCA